MDLSQLEIKIARSENLPVLPQVVVQVLQLIECPIPLTKEIEHAIEKDAGIAAKILRVANSPYYGGANIPTIGRAINLLGLNAVRTLVVSVGFRQTVGEKSTCGYFDKMEFWRHSLAVAVGARILGKMVSAKDADQLYTIGIMHDVGLLALDRFAPYEFEESMHLARTEKISLHAAEGKLRDFDHTNVGSFLAKSWGLSEEVASAIRHHHEAMMDTEHFSTTNIVEVANVLAYQLGYKNNCPWVDLEVTEEMASGLGLPLGQFEAIGKVVVAEVEKAQDSFSQHAAAA